MSIVAMKKIRLIAVQSQKAEILKELMLLGCVQIDSPKDEDSGSLKLNGPGMLLELNSRRTGIQNALKQLNRYVPYKKGLLTPLPEVTVEKLLDETGLEAAEASAKRILDADLEMKTLTAAESKVRSTIEAMTPWIEMDQDLSQTGTETCELMYGTIPAAISRDRVENAVEALEAQLTICNQDGQSWWTAIVYRKGIQEEVLAMLRNVGFLQVNLSGYSGTPAVVIRDAKAELEQLAEQKKEQEAVFAAEAENRGAIQLAVDTLTSIIAREEAGSKTLNSQSTFVFEGWLTAPDEERLGQVLERFVCAWETEEPDPDEAAEVPIKLKNNKLTEPYNLVTEMYSLPSYDGLDPNPFVAPFFALFFGIMFADMAYGLILLIGGLLFQKKAKPRGYLASLIIECGVTITLMGFLTGGLFGNVVTVIGGWFGKTWQAVPNFGAIHIGESITLTLPLDLLAGNNPLYVLIGAIALGAIHLLLGVIIGCYLKIRDGQWADAIFNDLCWWVMMAGIGFMVVGKGMLVLWIGVGMMVLGSLITGEGFGKITGIVGAVYNGATGYLGDFLSYSRLMALMLAGSVIASVFNQLGGLGNANGMTIGGTILFILVFIIGHALNFGLNVIGCFVHTLRLQYLEFFGKWYRSGGKPFKPLNIKTKYYEVTKEE